MDIRLVIPARFASSRYPGKPLVDLAGLPMIVRTWRQCVQALEPERVLVATDDSRILEVCERHGARCMVTSPDCLTGTDRLVEVASRLDADCLINVQGDEPLFEPDNIRRLVEAVNAHPGEVLNGFCPVQNVAEFHNPSLPKVVMRPDGRLLYMSRAGIPMDKDLCFRGAFRQVCAYAFPRKALEAFGSARGKTSLEAVEDIEILRFLELGWEVRMLPMVSVCPPLDSPADLPAILAAIHRREGTAPHLIEVER